jgi:hypothetical protein
VIKFTQQSASAGQLIGLGLSIDNLKRVCEQSMPIVFDASDVKLGDGKFCIGTQGMAAALRAQLGGAYRSCIELDEGTVARLLAGEPVEISLGALGYPVKGVVLLFVGTDEDAMLGQLRGAGLVAPRARVVQAEKLGPQESAWPLLLGGVFLVALSGIGFSSGKTFAAFAVAAGGLAVVAWALSKLKPSA